MLIYIDGNGHKCCVFAQFAFFSLHEAVIPGKWCIYVL